MFNGRETVDGLREAITSMESQLVALYEERQLQVSDGGEVAALQETIKNLEDQLVSLYSERDSNSLNRSEENEMIASLEDQVKALTDEKMELEAQIDRAVHERREIQARARDLGSALFEAAVFGKSRESA